MKKPFFFLSLFLLLAVNAWAIPPMPPGPSYTCTAAGSCTFTNSVNLSSGSSAVNTFKIGGDLATGILKYTNGGTWSSENPNSGVAPSSGTATITNSQAILSNNAGATLATCPTGLSTCVYELNAKVTLVTNASGTNTTTPTAVSCSFYKVGTGSLSSLGYSNQAVSGSSAVWTWSGAAATRITDVNLGPVLYTATPGDAISVWCGLGASLTAGAMTSDQAPIVFKGMFQ